VDSFSEKRGLRMVAARANAILLDRISTNPAYRMLRIRPHDHTAAVLHVCRFHDCVDRSGRAKQHRSGENRAGGGKHGFGPTDKQRLIDACFQPDAYLAWL
jgi:hypothetical protein